MRRMRQLPLDGMRIRFPRWTAVHRQPECLRVITMEIADAASGEVLRNVAVSDLASPMWSPNGKQLSATQENSVWTIDPETGESRRVIQLPSNFVPIFRAAWTQDGKYVILNRRQRLSHIVLVENFWTP